MNVRKLLMLMLLSVFSVCDFSHGHAQELLNEEQIIEPPFEKIYVSPDRLLIYPEGIFYLNEVDDVTPARLISSDASGLYVVKALPRKCPHCNRYVNRRTNQCQTEDCKMFEK